MPFEVDPIEFGRLVQSVETLTISVTALAAKVEALEEKLSTGRGMLWGAAAVIVGISGGVGALAHSLLSRVTE